MRELIGVLSSSARTVKVYVCSARPAGIVIIPVDLSMVRPSGAPLSEKAKGAK
jgi:hypothetical protein